ncbi:MAG: hypothetical protein NVS9B12_05390 [Vulcanimicrobiaceae bacterium]
MQNMVFAERLLTLVMALGVAGFHAWRGTREQRFVVAPAALFIAILVALNALSAAVGYGLLCLTTVTVYLIKEERAQRRRIASLAPRPAIEALAAIWIASAALSASMVLPYIAIPQQRIAAIIISLCGIVMAIIAWRIASAPVRLAGNDIGAERVSDRAHRLLRTGITCALAAGIAMVFTSFVNPQLPATTPPLYHDLQEALWPLAVALMVWVALFSYRLSRVSGRDSCE